MERRVSHVVSRSLSDGEEAHLEPKPRCCLVLRHTPGGPLVCCPPGAFQGLPMDLAFIVSGQHRVRHFFYVPIRLGPAPGTWIHTLPEYSPEVMAQEEHGQVGPALDPAPQPLSLSWH